MFLYRANKYSNKNNIYANIIRECYMEILGREPDPSGLNTYTRQLKRGWSKIDIKMDLYNSPEGKMVLMRKIESQSQPQLQSEKEPNNKNLFYESVETDKLSDLEFFNIMEKNVKTTWNKYNNNNIIADDSNNEVKSYKITKGFVNESDSESTKILYCVKKSTYNKFYIEDTNEKDCIKIYIKSKNKNLYLKVSDTNLNNIEGVKLVQENFINNSIAATTFKKIYNKDNNKFYLLVKSGLYINEKLLNNDEVNKYFIIDNRYNICKLINHEKFASITNDTTLKFWL